MTPVNGLHLNISDGDNSLNYDLAMEISRPLYKYQLKKTAAHG